MLLHFLRQTMRDNGIEFAPIAKRSLSSRMNLELRIQMLDMIIDRLHADTQPLRDLFVGIPFREPRQNFQFASRESIHWAGTGKR